MWFDLPSHHARQDDGFAGHVEAREVVPWVGLGVVEIDRLPYRFGEGSAALDRAHDETQGAARARLYLQYLVPRLEQASYGRNYGHTSTYRGLVPETVWDHAHELAVLGRAARERSFVGEHEISSTLYAEHIEVEGGAVHGHVYDYPREAGIGLRPEHLTCPRRLDTSPRYRDVRANLCALPGRSGRRPALRARGLAGLSPAASRYLFAGEVSCGWDQASVQRAQRLEAHVGGHDEHEPGGRNTEVFCGDARRTQATPAALEIIVVRRANADHHSSPSLASVCTRDLHGHVLP